MKPTSIFAASFVEGTDDFEGTEWTYPNCVRYRAATIERFASESGLAGKRLDWFHSGGQTWYAFFLHGLEPDIESLATLNQVAPMKQEITHYRQQMERLERIESHPLVRIALSLRRLLRRRWKQLKVMK